MFNCQSSYKTFVKFISNNSVLYTHTRKILLYVDNVRNCKYKCKVTLVDNVNIIYVPTVDIEFIIETLENFMQLHM